MRASLKRHPLAILRSVIGLSQVAFAELLGCSVPTVQSIEVGPSRLVLSSELANRVVQCTGVSFKWLMDGDPLAPIVEHSTDEPYTREHFENLQAGLKYKDLTPLDIQQLHARINALLMREAEKGRAAVAVYKLEQAIHTLELYFAAYDR